jgi:hypothetical protein
LKEEIFQDCLKYYKESDGHTKFWPDLSEKWGYPPGDKLRDDFKRERRRRGIPSRNDLQTACENTSKTQQKDIPKILLFDTENSAILGFVWGLYDQNLSYDRVVEDWHSLCWSAKWLFNPEIMFDVLTPREAKNHDDKRITESMWNLINQADILVAHNALGFDIKKLNTRFVKHGFTPPKPYQVIDTLVQARSNFAFTSNKLDDLCAFFGFPQKIDTNFNLWKRCFYGESDALTEMSEYNKNDSVILEEIYLKLRPFIKGHPNYNLWNVENISVCPNCGGEIEFGGDYYTLLNRYDAWKCKECGAVGRSKKSNLDKEKSKLIVR